MPRPLTIGRLAKLAEVNIETFRYYERRGLLPDPPRTEAGYRQYDMASVVRLRFIKEAQGLGFSLDEIADLLAMRVDTNTTCDEVRHRAERKLADVASKIDFLQAIRATLETMIAACQRNDLVGECPFLETTEQHALERIMT